jgi:AmiR/NasT family two-component response regulator
MIMERFKVDAIQAFELLKRLSQSSNRPLAGVARQLVESEDYGQ